MKRPTGVIDLAAILVSLIGVGLCMCGGEAEERAPEAAARAQEPVPAEAPPTPPSTVPYEVVDETVGEDAMKAQVELRIVIGRETTREQLDQLMRKVYEEQSNRTGFKVREHPNSVFAFIYYSKQSYLDNPMSWVGRIAKAAADSEPTYNNNIIAGGLMAQLKEGMGLKDSPGPRDDTAQLGEDGETVIYTEHLTEMSGEYSDISDIRGVWISVFGGLDFLYKKASNLDRLSYRIIHEGKPLIRLDLTRALWEEMAYARTMSGIAPAEAAIGDAFMAEKLDSEEFEEKISSLYRTAYREMLKKLPRKNVEIAKKVKP